MSDKPELDDSEIELRAMCLRDKLENKELHEIINKRDGTIKQLNKRIRALEAQVTEKRPYSPF